MTGVTGVRSEVGALGTVLLHRPGEELARITPSNRGELLFDELLWLEHAQVEHDAFAEVLRDAGVEVLYVEELLTELVADDELAVRLTEHHVTARTCGPEAVDHIRSRLREGSARELVDHLIAGISREELGELDGLVAAVSEPGAMILDPLPNLVFMRDSSAWIGEGVVLAPMNRPVRRRETDLLRTLYHEHPRFAGAPVWFGDAPGVHHPATLEGGDLLVVGERGVAIGLSERSTPAGVESLATRLLRDGVVDRVLVVALPRARAAMHLDTVVTQVDVDAFLLYPRMSAALETYRVERGAHGHLHVRAAGGLLDGLAWAAGAGGARAIQPELSSTRAEREQWNDANNTLALSPGVVVAYERNVATNAALDAAGIAVHTIPSFELPRGRGGPRCMSCPVARGPVTTPGPPAAHESAAPGRPGRGDPEESQIT